MWIVSPRSIKKHLWIDEASTRETSPAIIGHRRYEMTIESFIDTLNVEQQQAAFDLLWQRLSADPHSLPSPTWHGEVLSNRSENPSSGPKMTVSEAKIEVKRMVDERRNSR